MITKIFQIKVCPTFSSLTAPSCKWLYVDLGFGDPVCKEEEAAKLFNRLFQFLNAIWVATNSLHKNIVASSDNCSSQQQQPVATRGICLTETVHTPPEGWVRAKIFCITFDTNFSCYLPRGTIIDGSRKCRMGAFCTIAKISGEMPKKALKTGQNGVKNFLGPHTYWIITFLAFFYFQYFSFWWFTDLQFYGN